MAAYVFKGKSKAALNYSAPGACAIQELIDIPDLIANPDQLALASAPDAGLSAFVGFAQNDTLKIPIPAGFSFGVNPAGLIVLETQAITVDVGDSRGATTFHSNGSLAAAVFVASSASVHTYIADDYILLTFDQTGPYTTASFIVFLNGFLVDL